LRPPEDLSATGPIRTKLTARLTGRVLRGAKPSELPVVQSARFEFIVNLKTAKALGISRRRHCLPPSLGLSNRLLTSALGTKKSSQACQVMCVNQGQNGSDPLWPSGRVLTRCGHWYVTMPVMTRSSSSRPGRKVRFSTLRPNTTADVHHGPVPGACTQRKP
jgi:hypothetical protein